MSISDILANASALVTILGGIAAVVRIIWPSKTNPPSPLPPFQPQPPPPLPVPQPPQLRNLPVLGKNPDTGIRGEWLSETTSPQNVELALGAVGKTVMVTDRNPYAGSYAVVSKGSYRITGNGKHWSCGTVSISGDLDASGDVKLTLTPVQKSTISSVRLNLILLQGKMSGQETIYESRGKSEIMVARHDLTLIWTGF